MTYEQVKEIYKGFNNAEPFIITHSVSLDSKYVNQEISNWLQNGWILETSYVIGYNVTLVFTALIIAEREVQRSVDNDQPYIFKNQPVIHQGYNTGVFFI